MKKLIFFLFAFLFFFVPLVLWPFTSEVFEFNKMVLVYALTVLIFSAWLARTVLAKRIIFRRTILDIPLLVFLGSQIISTILSIDPLTSFLGYYSRFNGGLLSTICYALLYWVYVSNFDKDDTIKLVKYSILPSAALVAIYGVLEHFGIDKSIWVQDVQSRVFSTLGQPNWLAAWLVALLPITWTFALEEKVKIKICLWLGYSALFFTTLLFTGSRSGLLGIAVAFVIFWAGYFWINRNQIKKQISYFGFITISLILISLIFGTQFTPSIGVFLSKQQASPTIASASAGTALETGGTESGTIRRIVWKGATQVWLHYPIFGTGVETFAYSYYLYRPVEHNVTSEWDFIYNKAHNEFLNMAANSGTFGLISYLILIGFSIYQILRLKSPMAFALLAGYISISVTNFFGFSVVPIQLEFFLFPAIAVACSSQNVAWKKTNEINKNQKIMILCILLATSYLLLVIYQYWSADILYNKGKSYNQVGQADVATQYLGQAISLEPNQPLYHNELGNSYTTIALNFFKQKDKDNTTKFTNLALGQSQATINMSPANVNFERSRFGVFIMLSTIDPNFLISARDTLLTAIKLAPTDAKLYYNLGLTYARIGQTDLALTTLKKTIDLKADYRDARLAYALLLVNVKRPAEAKVQLEYILTKIDPNDSLTKQTLAGIK